MSFIEGAERGQINLLPACMDDYVAPEARVLTGTQDQFVSSEPVADAARLCAGDESLQP